LLVSLGFSRRAAAEALEIDPSTISRAVKRDAALAGPMGAAEARWRLLAAEKRS